MGLFNGAWLVVLGVLGAASLVVARRPDAKFLVAKLAPYQGWIGAVSAFSGIWTVLSAILNAGTAAHVPVYWVSLLAVGILQCTLGLLLGVGIIKQFIKDSRAQATMDRTMIQLAPKQGALGLTAIGLGAWMCVAGFIFHV